MLSATFVPPPEGKPMQHKDLLTPETRLAPLCVAGFTAAFVLVGILGGWAATVTIGGAVIASGHVQVAGKPKTVQTLDGGVLSEILVRDGDFVSKGQVLARLDPTQLEISLDLARARLAAALSLRERLEAERTHEGQLDFDYSDMKVSVHDFEADIRKAEGSQRDIFHARLSMRLGARKQLRGRLADLDSQSQGVVGQINALEQQLLFLRQDAASISALLDKGLSRHDRLTDVLRKLAALQGNLAQRQSELAGLVNKRREITEIAEQEELSSHEHVVTELRDLYGEIEELTFGIVMLQTQLQQIALRAPASGIIHEVQMTTIGGVISPGQTLLQVIPQDSGFAFEVRVPPRDINKVRMEQPAQIVLTALDPQITPKLAGRVGAVSPQTVDDPLTGKPFYRVALNVSQKELARLPQSQKLVSGMPLEVFLQTGEKTVLSYLTEPLRAQLSYGFRE
jgi:HlyD family secretion protein